jgi:hypothetical protein
MTREPAGARSAATRTAGAHASAATRTRVGGGRYGLDGAYLYHDTLSAGEVPTVLEQFRQLGMDTVIVTSVRSKATSCSSNSYSWLGTMPGMLGTILTEAQKLGLSVYVGLTESSGVCAGFDDATNRSQDATDMGSAVSTILASYGSNPALAGWYIPNEEALAFQTNQTTLDSEWAYYLAVRNAIRAQDATRPISVAPYLGNADGLGLQLPSAVATRCANFRTNTGGDLVIVMQDSVGADGMSVGWPRTGDRGYPTRQYYDAIAAAVGPANVWANCELNNYPAGPFVGGNYTPTSAVRLTHQLANAQACAKRVCWNANIHLMPEDANAKVESASLKARYKAIRGLAGEFVRPVSYTWTTAREAAHPDPGNALFDRWTGDPRNLNDAAWVGFANGGCVVTVDMGSTKTLNWVAAQTLEVGASSYRHPTSIKIETSPDNSAWTDRGTTTMSLAASDGEYTIGNTAALSVSCRYVRATLANAASKTLVSEMEIVANA